ncbi:hypothetical protein PPERSA_03505 [Pseudocohnilembus persalinus]|uniref:Uncharacterized protein n=1 Tax=Pseudocohnilembus persalinus TaxID=266149 RepID=A0A0V0R2S5_PSEPJ|nr:hypothetical protein PPERSA_03505 [Pseudocohnilembus persalinus]|eukprot:KRX08634.1 hypothetical protein PPERSA_03505 [Pseudocohnilembus persalinus]
MYNFSIGQNASKDPYSYGLDNDSDKQVPSYMAKTKKSNGFGGLSSLNKKKSDNQTTIENTGNKFGGSLGMYGNSKGYDNDPYEYEVGENSDQDEYGEEYDQYEQEDINQYYEQDYGKGYPYKVIIKKNIYVQFIFINNTLE